MVRIVYNENIEEAIVAELQTGLAEFGATVTTEKFKTGVLNTWGWWMLPPLLGILIGKPFLDSFFKELGEESAKKFKQLLGSVFTRLKKKGSRFYTAEDFRAIQKGADPQSRGQACPILGIVFEIETTETQKWRLRCLLPANLEESEVDQAI
ncbi:MAG TPA: hypothetical protein VNU95_00390, partial [Candidatus Acidoferrales bacterium]|nr:hypothetical protein [Candidatus Acidoferrales bacterium]